MKAIIFDLDGTLLNTLDDLANAANFTMEAIGFATHPVEKYKYMVGNGIPMLLQRALQQTNMEKALLDKALYIFSKYYSEHKLDCTKPYDGIIDALAVFKSKGLALCVATNKDNNFAKDIVENFFPKTFDFVLGRCKDIPAKPNPFMVNQIMANLKLNPTDVLYVGDSGVDMQTAKNAKLTACGVLWGFRKKPELMRAGADYIIASPNELDELLQKIKDGKL